MPLLFSFDLSLEARAGILEIFSLLFWDKRLFHKDFAFWNHLTFNTGCPKLWGPHLRSYCQYPWIYYLRHPTCYFSQHITPFKRLDLHSFTVGLRNKFNRNTFRLKIVGKYLTKKLAWSHWHICVLCTMKYPGWILNFTHNIKVILNLFLTFPMYKWRKFCKVSK